MNTELLPPLVRVGDLSGVRGAPTDQPTLDRIADRIRRLCGWHIAPEITQTVLLDSQGQDVLPLPTLRLVSVTAVRYWTGSEMAALDGWDMQTGWSAESCTIHKPGGFPRGRRAIEVTMIHGYPELPATILDALVDITGHGRIVQESLGSRSVTFSDAAPRWGALSVLDRYRLGPRP